MIPALLLHQILEALQLLDQLTLLEVAEEPTDVQEQQLHLFTDNQEEVVVHQDKEI
jgi:hypothetical protein